MVYVTSGRGNKLLNYPISRNLETNIQFIAIPMKDGDLAYMRKINNGE